MTFFFVLKLLNSVEILVTPLQVLLILDRSAMNFVRLKWAILGVGTPTVLVHLVLGLDLDRKTIVSHREGSFGTVSCITAQWICTYAEILIAKLSSTSMEKTTVL